MSEDISGYVRARIVAILILAGLYAGVSNNPSIR